MPRARMLARTPEEGFSKASCWAWITGPHHELAGGLQVEERDPREVHHDGLAERADAVERLPQVRQGVGVELSPNAYLYPRPVVYRLDAVQGVPSRTFPGRDLTTRGGREKLREGVEILGVSRAFRGARFAKVPGYGTACGAARI